MDFERIVLAHQPDFVIGRLSIHPSRRALLRDDGLAEVLEHRVMQVLIALAKAQCAIVTRDELILSCWEGRVVGDDAINRVISRLRKTAAGIGVGSFVVETVTKIGYRLTGDVVGATADVGPHLFAPSGSGQLSGRRSVLVGGAVVAALGAGGWALLKGNSADAPDSIAVLPFENLSGDPAQAYFADSIAGEIRNTLTRYSGLRVVGSTSSAAVRNEDARTAAKKLGVANIVTGNLRQTSSTVRVNAELIDGNTGLATWSQNYDRAPGDIIGIQTDIAKNVARSLTTALGASANVPLAAGETSNVGAQTLVFQARELSYELTVSALNRTLQLVDKAISLDPNYARAFAIKSFAFNQLVSRTARNPNELASGRNQALQYARAALSIAPKLPIARSALGFAYSLSLRLGDSLREHATALSLASGDPDVIRNYGWTASKVVSKQKGALRYVDEALALDPFNWVSHFAHVEVLINLRRYRDAANYSLELKRKSPELFRFPQLLGRSLVMLARMEEAALAFAEIPDQDARNFHEAVLAARTNNREPALTMIDVLRERGSEMASYEIGLLYAQLSEKDRAFQALNRAWEIRLSDLGGIMTEPYIDPLRKDPRYAKLLRRIRFPS